MTHVEPESPEAPPPEIEPVDTPGPDIDPGGGPDELPPYDPGGGEQNDSRSYDGGR